MKLFPKTNEFDNFLDTPKYQQIVNRSCEKYKERAYMIENESLYAICSHATKFLGGVSVLASFPMIVNAISLMVVGKKVLTSEFTLNDLGFVVVLFGLVALIFLGFVEYFKQTLFSKVVAQNLKKVKNKQKEIFFVWLLLLGFSVYTAIEGSAEVATFSSVVPTENLNDTKELAKSYDSQIEQLNKEIADVKKAGSGYTWNGALTDKGRAQITKLTGQRDKLISNKESGVTTAKLENMTKENEAANKGNENANLVRFVIALIEVIIMFGCYYVEKYEHTVFMEVEFNSLEKPTERAKEVQEKRENVNFPFMYETLFRLLDNKEILAKMLALHEIGGNVAAISENAKEKAGNKESVSESEGEKEGNEESVSEGVKPTKIGFPHNTQTKLDFSEAKTPPSRKSICANPNCAKEYEKNTTWQKFCSKDCNNAAKTYDVQEVIRAKNRKKGSNKA